MIFMNFKIDLAASRNVNISKFIPVVFISREIQDERLAPFSRTLPANVGYDITRDA